MSSPLTASNTTTVWLVRHASASQPAHLPEPDWPLTPAGHEQAQSLAGILAGLDVQHLFASSYIRAQQTLMPFAKSSGLALQVRDDLRERRLAADLIDDYRSALAVSFAQIDHRLPGGESLADCRRRMQGVISDIVATHPGSTSAVCSHGVAITALLGDLDPSIGFDFWQQLQNPHLIELSIGNGQTTWRDHKQGHLT